MKYYSLDACNSLIEHYMDNNGVMDTIEEGVLGLGVTVLTAPSLKTAVIKEVYLNEWSSTHTIRLYNATPKKYAKLTN